MRLNVRMLGVEQLLCAIYCKLLDLIDEFTAAVVPFSWKTFGVFVRERRAHRLEYCLGDEVLAGDQLESFALTLDLAPDDVGDVRVVLAQCLQLKCCALLNSLHSLLLLPPYRRSSRRVACACRPRTVSRATASSFRLPAPWKRNATESRERSSRYDVLKARQSPASTTVPLAHADTGWRRYPLQCHCHTAEYRAARRRGRSCARADERNRDSRRRRYTTEPRGPPA